MHRTDAGRWPSRIGNLATTPSLRLVVLLSLAAIAVWPAAASAGDPQEFGVAAFTTSIKDAAGHDETQAGAHPVSANTMFRFNVTDADPGVPVDDARSIHVNLPAGFSGNPEAVAGRCEIWRLTTKTCPADSVVGAVALRVVTGTTVVSPVWSLVPERGFPAEFGFASNGSPPITIYPRIRTEGDYGLTIDSPSVGRENLVNVDLTFCGFGTNISGSDALGWTFSGCKAPGDPGANATPFLTNPTDCDAGPPPTTLTVDSWQHPHVDHTYTAYATDPPSPVTGCDHLSFAPTVDVTPQTTRADTPSGYAVHVGVPQHADPTTPATPPLRDAAVTLPEGVSLSPGTADGLKGCTDAQIDLHSTAPNACPDASKVGQVHIATPLLGSGSGDYLPDGAGGPRYQLNGGIYLRAPDPGATRADGLYGIFLDIEDAQTGIVVKLKGDVVPDEQTGRLRATFRDNPPLPFTDFLLEFKGGPRAALANPPACGAAQTTATFTAWGGPQATPTSTFTVDADGHGGACPAVRPFAPTFTAGTLDPLAGDFSPFTMTIRRHDGDQELRNVQVDLPPGLLGVVKGVPRCGADDAAAGTCDPASRVGTTMVSAGAGDHPYSLPGKVYLGGRYKGEPLSLSIVVRAIAGPFDLGTVVVRAPIHVDAAHARLTVPADDLPTILQGVPLRLRTINVTLDRPGFTFNSTSCDPASISARLTGTGGAVATPIAPYRADRCGALPFHPLLTAGTSAKLRFKQGAALHTHITQQPGEAGMRSVAVTLPRQLPSRLIPTINNACLIAQYRQDPARCPQDSYVGTVRATTPVLSGELTGPAYIVAIPKQKPIIALTLAGHGENEGIGLELDGTIVVDSGGGRSKVTFDGVPDVPISSFDLDLPAGPHSALDAPLANLCDGPIRLGVSMVAQNGKRRDWNPAVAVAGCPQIPPPAIVGVRTARREVVVRVRPAAPGRIVVSSPSLRPAVRVAERVLTYSVHVPLTASARRRLAAHRSITTAMEVWFKPVNARTPLIVRRTVRIGASGSGGGRR